jgi:hypothetical protein
MVSCLLLPFAFYLLPFAFLLSSVLQQNRVYFRFCSASSSELSGRVALIFRPFGARREPKLFRASYYLLRVCHHIISGPRAETMGAGCSRYFLFKLLLERAA